MDWGQHISHISSKSIKTIGLLHTNLVFAPRSTKEIEYQTLVCPSAKLEYAAPNHGGNTNFAIFASDRDGTA